MNSQDDKVDAGLLPNDSYMSVAEETVHKSAHITSTICSRTNERSTQGKDFSLFFLFQIRQLVVLDLEFG